MNRRKFLRRGIALGATLLSAGTKAADTHESKTNARRCCSVGAKGRRRSRVIWDT